jgi:hypothetical protein
MYWAHLIAIHPTDESDAPASFEALTTVTDTCQGRPVDICTSWKYLWLSVSVTLLRQGLFAAPAVAATPTEAAIVASDTIAKSGRL